jgi:hypothetical protein
MNSLRRLRALAGLTESVADDPHTNREIERRLAKYASADERTVILDALETVKDAGEAGLAPREWMAKVREIHGNEIPDLGATLTAVKRDFAFVIHKNADGRFVWGSGMRDDDPMADMDPNIRGAISGQVELSSAAIAAARELDVFTPNDIAAAIRRRVPQYAPIAAAFASQFIEHFRGMLEPLGGGRFRMKPEQQGAPGTEGSMALLRSLAQRRDG